MSSFTAHLDIRFLDEGRAAQLLEPLSWECDYKGSGLVVTIPAGFVSDGMTVPRVLWWFMPPHGDRLSRAAWLHDYLMHLLRNETPHPHVVTYRDAAHQFWLALRALGAHPARAYLLWLGPTFNDFTKGRR